MVTAYELWDYESGNLNQSANGIYMGDTHSGLIRRQTSSAHVVFTWALV